MTYRCDSYLMTHNQLYKLGNLGHNSRVWWFAIISIQLNNHHSVWFTPIIPCDSVLPEISKQHLSQLMNQIGPFQSISYDSKPLNWYHLCELVSSVPLNSWSKILPPKNFYFTNASVSKFQWGPFKHFWEFRRIKPCFPSFLAVWHCTAKRKSDC